MIVSPDATCCRGLVQRLSGGYRLRVDLQWPGTIREVAVRTPGCSQRGSMEPVATQSPDTSRSYVVAIKRILAECVFVCHGFFAVGWWWLMPGGFRVGNV